MKYTLWYFDGDGKCLYDVFTGTRYECYRLRSRKSFSWQYKVKKCIW